MSKPKEAEQAECRHCDKPIYYTGTNWLHLHSGNWRCDPQPGPKAIPKVYLPGHGPNTVNSGSTKSMDPWKAVHRIRVNHEAVVNAATVVVNCAEWQGEDGPNFLAEAVKELKAALAKMPYTQPPAVNHD